LDTDVSEYEAKINADMVLYNGKIITVNDEFSIAEAVAIKNGKFIFVGTNEGAFKLAGSHTELLDLDKATVMPGIIDGHTHWDLAAQSELFEEIPDVNTLPELLSWVRLEARKKKKGEWIIHPTFFPTRLKEMIWPSLIELDEAAPENPVFLNGSYSGMINTAAMKASGILEDIKNPDLIRDKKSGKLNGIVRSSSFDLLTRIEKQTPSPAQRLDALSNMLNRYNQVGITSVCVGMGSPKSLGDYVELRKLGKLTVRIFQNMNVPDGGKAPIESIKNEIKSWNIKTGSGDEWIKVGSLKTWVDGGILTGTAWMKEPWGNKAAKIFGLDDANYRGFLLLDKNQLSHLIAMSADLGWKFSAHITGSGGVDVYLKAIEEVNKKIPLKGKRFSIIHGNFYSAEAIARMVRFGVYADMQPAWFYKDADAMEYVLGMEKMQDFHPYRSMIDAGVMINGGSDHMVKFDSIRSVNPYNPFLSIWSAVTHETERGSKIVPEEAVKREDGLRMYTINNAYASFEEDIKGSIEPGKLADLIVLSDDILECPAEKIKDISVKMTMVDGRIVYGKENALTKFANWKGDIAVHLYKQ